MTPPPPSSEKRCARRILLAGTFALVIVGCGHDTTALPTDSHLGADTVPAELALFNLPTKVAISPNFIPALALGATVQLAAVVTNQVGARLSTPVVWSSSNGAIAPVASDGLISAESDGTVIIRGRAQVAPTVGDSVVVVVNGVQPTSTASGETIANLPQVYLNTAMPAAPAAGGKIISVAEGGNLQAAINKALPGDVIELANGATFSGNFTLTNKGTSTNWIVIRPASMAGVPAEGSRMTPAVAAAARLPKVLSANNEGAFNTAVGAHHYRFVAIEVSVPATIANTGLIRLGTSYETSLEQMPHDLVLDRMYIHGTATGNTRRCVALNSASSAVIDSYISDCHAQGSDAQAIAGWSGPGPFKIVNNYLEGSGENVMFGGGDPTINGVIPSDIEIRRNHITKPVSWKGGPWLVKNLFELKNAQRVLVEGNVLENNWANGQTGTAINLKSVNQNGTCRWCVTQDVTFRYNLIKNTGGGFVLSGRDDEPRGQPVSMTRVTITHNVVSGINSGIFVGEGRGFLINNNPIDLVIAHNTVVEPTLTAITFGGPATDPPVRLTFRDNIVGGGQYAVNADGMGAAAAISRFVPAGGWRGNVMIVSAANLSASLSGTSFATMQGVGFVNPGTLDFRLSPSSSFRGRATDGRDPGADITALNSAIDGVVIP